MHIDSRTPFQYRTNHLFTSCWNGLTSTRYMLFRGHRGTISGFLHVRRIRLIARGFPAITRIDSLRPSRPIFLPYAISSTFSSLRVGLTAHEWLIRGPKVLPLLFLWSVAYCLWPVHDTFEYCGRLGGSGMVSTAGLVL